MACERNSMIIDSEMLDLGWSEALSESFREIAPNIECALPARIVREDLGLYRATTEAETLPVIDLFRNSSVIWPTYSVVKMNPQTTNNASAARHSTSFTSGSRTRRRDYEKDPESDQFTISANTLSAPDKN